MMDGRYDQQFAELFVASLADENRKERRPSLWPLTMAIAMAAICGLVVFTSTALLA